MLSLVLSGFLFGTGGLLGSLLGRVTALPPLAVAAYRLVAGGSLLIGFLLLTSGVRRLPRGRTAWARVAGVGTLAATSQGCYFAAVSLTSVTSATLITIGAMPVLVLAAERVLGRRRTDRRMITVLLLALAGLGLLVGTPSGGTVAGTGLAVLAAGAFAALTMLGARPVAGPSERACERTIEHCLDPPAIPPPRPRGPGAEPARRRGSPHRACEVMACELPTIGIGFVAGGLLLISVAGSLSFQITAASSGLLLALAVAPTAVAYPLYFHGSRTAGAGTAAVLTLLEPLTGSVLAALLLGDRLGAFGVCGAVLLGAAMVFAARPWSFLGVNPEWDFRERSGSRGLPAPTPLGETSAGQSRGESDE